MSDTNRPTVFATGVLILLMLFIISWGCGSGNSGTEGEKPLVLRSYEIAPELGTELSTILNGVLDRGEETPPVGRVELGPGGQLIVAAPEDIHQGIEKMLDDIKNAMPEPPPMITTTYWIMAGSPAEETIWPSRLEELGLALGSIASADGPTDFTLLEKAQLHSLSGEKGMAVTRLFRIEQRATSREGQIFASLRLTPRSIGGGDIDTRVNLRPDQLLVLGQSALPKQRGGQDDTDSSLYIIVRARVEATTSR